MPRILLSLILLALAACQTIPKDQLDGRISVLKENGFQQVGEDWELGMANRLLFGTDESRLLDEQKARLTSLAQALSGVGITGARIEGYTDSTGASAYNLALSGRRAEAVRESLIGGGMNANAVRAIARGEVNPIESNRTVEGRQENRRVVIIISSADLD